jgi:hypothetical protein
VRALARCKEIPVLARLLLTLALAGGLLPLGTTALADQDPPPAGPKVLAPDRARPARAKQPSPRKLALRPRVTEETEVLLDGRPCRYEEVPRGAVITFLAIAADRQTIRAVHFQSHK